MWLLKTLFLMEIGHKYKSDVFAFFIYEFLSKKCYNTFGDIMTFGSIVFKYRKKAKLSEQELAAKLKVKPKLIEYWENDQLMPSEKYFQDLVFLLRIPEKEVVEHYVIRREAHHLEKTGMILLFLLIAILGSYLLPFLNQNGAAFLLAPKLNLTDYIIAYVAMWFHIMASFIALGILLKYLINSRVTQQKKLFVLLKYPLIVTSISSAVPMIQHFFELKMGYFAIFTFSMFYLIIYLIRYRKMRKLMIIGEEA